MHLTNYLQRIHYSGPTAPTADTLSALHRAHLLTIPFENLDIHLRRPIHLTDEALFNKLVIDQRGGFCFEQNGLFSRMLRELGFKVTLLEANVIRADGTYGIPFNHLTLLVELDERYLVDVGFGDSFIEPLRLDDPVPQIQQGKAYRVEHDGKLGYYYAQDESGTWAIQYRFFLTPRQLTDYHDACRYMQTSPETHFTQKRICSRATPTGRISLSDTKLIVTEHDNRTEHSIADEAEFLATLQTHFGIVLDGFPERILPA